MINLNNTYKLLRHKFFDTHRNSMFLILQIGKLTYCLLSIMVANTKLNSNNTKTKLAPLHLRINIKIKIIQKIFESAINVFSQYNTLAPY